MEGTASDSWRNHALRQSRPRPRPQIGGGTTSVRPADSQRPRTNDRGVPWRGNRCGQSLGQSEPPLLRASPGKQAVRLRCRHEEVDSRRRRRNLELDISPTNDRLVFGRNVEDGKVSNEWTMSLDPKTGLATAPAKRLALTPGDQPRF